MPRTTELLKESFGPVLRTALFSRLEPRTILGAHSGWSDLANHVLRVHIPISVPSGSSNEGLCGVSSNVSSSSFDELIYNTILIPFVL